MKLALSATIGVSMVLSASAWVAVSPSAFVKECQKVASVASIVAAVALSPLASNAASDVVAGSYADPNHPNCQRVITVVEGSSSEIVLKGTDGNPGCPPDGSGNAWQLTGSVDGSNVFVDFSPKGGPKDLKGVFDDSAKAIQWPDGNVWTQKKVVVASAEKSIMADTTETIASADEEVAAEKPAVVAVAAEPEKPVVVAAVVADVEKPAPVVAAAAPAAETDKPVVVAAETAAAPADTEKVAVVVAETKPSAAAETTESIAVAEPASSSSVSSE